MFKRRIQQSSLLPAIDIDIAMDQMDDAEEAASESPFPTRFDVTQQHELRSDEKSELVIASNRLPVREVDDADGGNRWEMSPGGLVSALTPILQKKSSAWIGWIGSEGASPSPFRHSNIFNVPVELTEEEIEKFYEGFCNRTIWPLFHDATQTPEYRRSWWWTFVEINKRFAHSTANHVRSGGVAWIHDYHLQLVPQALRDDRPDLRIGFFLHIPFPPAALFAQIPWRKQLIEGILGSDVIGFQTADDAANFCDAATRFTDAARSSSGLNFEKREIVVRDFPISIDVKRFESASRSEEVADRMVEIREKVGHNRKILLGVDRLDYTKGIDIRLRAYRECLESGKITSDNTVLVQVAVPSRESVPDYQRLRDDVAGLVGEINGTYGRVGQVAVHYLHRNMPFDELVALYRVADVMLVTPIKDGMNLVAKEYVASRRQDNGVLILSEFAGAASELDDAITVNPFDLSGLSTQIEAALIMPAEEQQRRMNSLRKTVQRYDVFKWAKTFLSTLNQ